MKILHAFADTGVESYVLQEYGKVTRLGINPSVGLRDTENFEGANEIVQADGKQMPFEENEFDLGFGHPPCTPFSKWAAMNESRLDGYERPESIVREARTELSRVSKDYVIENKPNADIRNDLVLEGNMFDIPYQKRRAFECSFEVREPPEQEEYIYVGETNESKYFVMKNKGYPNLWPGKEAKNASIPRPYIEFIMRCYLESLED